MRIAKVVSLSLSATLLAGMVGITGCGTRTDNNNMRSQGVRNNTQGNYDVNSLRDGNRNFTRSLGNGQSERINSLKYSPALSNKVSQLREVQSAHVVVTDRDAYVAVTLHGNQHGRAIGPGRGMTTNYGATGYGTTNVLDGNTRGAVNYGTAGNMMGYGTRNGTGIGTGYGTSYGTTGYGTTSRTPSYGTTGNGTTSRNPNGLIDGTRTDDGLGRGLMGRSGVAGSLFDTATRGNRGTTGMNGGTDGIGMKSTRHRNTTNVDGTGNGSVVGLGTGTGAGLVDNVPQSVKDEISKAVKKTAPHIRNVHVSGHQEFVTHVSNYATQSRTGATLQGYVGDFEHLVNRIFPGRAGTMTGPNGYRNTGGGTGSTGTGTGMSGTTGTGTGSGAGFSGGVTR